MIVTGTGKVGALLAPHLGEFCGLSAPEIDLRSFSSWAALFHGHRFVIHLAANPSPNCGMEAAADNIQVTANVLRAADGEGAKVIFASSVWAEPEKHGLKPTLYGLSKLASERLVSEAGGASLRLGAVRPGPEAPDWVKQLSMGDETVARLFLNQWRD